MITTPDGREVPDPIGHDYHALEIDDISFLETEFARNHRRLKVFYEKGVQCAVPGCPHVGVYVIAARGITGGIHYDVYTKDFVLMTVDHIVPKAKGGGEHLNNKQPMCNRHNSKKGAKLDYQPE